jgi:site-specific DNA-methyltransferase (adenine-specific)
MSDCRRTFADHRRISEDVDRKENKTYFKHYSKITTMLTITNEDNMIMMSRYPDNYFDLAIVDPPYGLGKRTTDGGSKKNTQTKFMDDIRRTNWDDKKPSKNYFSELFRVSKNSIIWGGNYFNLHSYRTFIVWEKMTFVPTMSQVELAYTTFDKPARIIKINSNQKNRIHPTQKPVRLYEWLLKNYAKEGDKILDTHLGSGSIAIACHNLHFDLTACELDKDYFDSAMKRIKQHQQQLRIF